MSWLRRTRELPAGHFVSYAACLVRQGGDGVIELHGYSMEDVIKYLAFLQNGLQDDVPDADSLDLLRNRPHP